MNATANQIKEHSLLCQGDMIVALLEERKRQTRRVPGRFNSLVDGARVSEATWDRLDFYSERVFVDNGLSPAGNTGPYLHVPTADGETVHRVYPVWQVGDRIRVRENWRTRREWDALKPTALPIDADHLRDPEWCRDQFITYAAADTHAEKLHGKLRPGIHLPRWACRIELVVTKVRVERVRDISGTDAIDEGIERVSRGMETCWKNYLPQSPYDFNELTLQDETGRVIAFANPVRSFRTLWDSINGRRAGGIYAWEKNPWVWVIAFEKRGTRSAERGGGESQSLVTSAATRC